MFYQLLLIYIAVSDQVQEFQWPMFSELAITWKLINHYQTLFLGINKMSSFVSRFLFVLENVIIYPY